MQHEGSRPQGAVQIYDALGKLPRHIVTRFVDADKDAPELRAAVAGARRVIEAAMVAFVSMGDADDPITATWAVIANRWLNSEPLDQAPPPPTPAWEPPSLEGGEGGDGG